MWSKGTSVRFLLFLLREKTKDSKKQSEDEEKRGINQVREFSTVKRKH